MGIAQEGEGCSTSAQQLSLQVCYLRTMSMIGTVSFLLLNIMHISRIWVVFVLGIICDRYDGEALMRKKHTICDGFLPIPVGQLSRKLKSRYGARNRFQEPGMELSTGSPATVQRLAGRYDNPMPTWFLVFIAGLKLPTQDPSLKADIFYFYPASLHAHFAQFVLSNKVLVPEQLPVSETTTTAR